MVIAIGLSDVTWGKVNAGRKRDWQSENAASSPFSSFPFSARLNWVYPGTYEYSSLHMDMNPPKSGIAFISRERGIPGSDLCLVHGEPYASIPHFILTFMLSYVISEKGSRCL